MNYHEVFSEGFFLRPNVLGHPAARRKPEFNKATYRRRMRRLVLLLFILHRRLDAIIFNTAKNASPSDTPSSAMLANNGPIGKGPGVGFAIM